MDNRNNRNRGISSLNDNHLPSDDQPIEDNGVVDIDEADERLHQRAEIISPIHDGTAPPTNVNPASPAYGRSSPLLTPNMENSEESYSRFINISTFYKDTR
jgi:hypothetical protein